MKKGHTPRRVAAAILATDLYLTSINLRDLERFNDLDYTDKEWGEIEEAACKIVFSVLGRLERIAGDISPDDLPTK